MGKNYEVKNKEKITNSAVNSDLTLYSKSEKDWLVDILNIFRFGNWLFSNFIGSLK